MSFQIKDFVSIVASQVNHMRGVTDKITDFLPGSVARTLVEAPAVEIEELYLQMLLGLRDAIPVATFKSFGFEKLPAARAHGFVSISLTPAPVDPITIPLGTAFGTTDGRVYTSTEARVWAAGVSVVRVPVQASVIGAAGNVAAGAINSTTLAGDGYVVSNSAITTGRDVESDQEREARFAEFVRSLSRGTVSACRFAVSSASILDEDGNLDEYVTRVGMQEDLGRLRLWIYSSKGLASAALVERAQQLLDGYTAEDGTVVPGYRPAGVRVEALQMVERSIPLTVSVSMFPGYDLTTAVRQSIADRFASTVRSVPPGETLYLKTLVEDMLAVDGVRLIVPQSSENIACASNEALIPGLLTINEL